MPTPEYERQPVAFDSGGVECAGYLYLPDDGTSPGACVVTANGFSATMDWILPSFAQRFAAAGFATLTFDYRHLGASGGEPRQLIDVRRQREDLARAVDFARARLGLPMAGVALWGTSLGGSHVIVYASENPGLGAVIANVPMLDAIRGSMVSAKTRKAGLGPWRALTSTLRLAAAAVGDALRSLLPVPPLYLQVYGEPGRAVFTDPSMAERFHRLERESPWWENRFAARFLLQLLRYREGTIERIDAPMLFCLASYDVEVSTEFVKRKAARARRAEVREYPVEHFDVYHGEVMEQVAGDQVEFLRRQLPAVPL